jgi:hypothetical protein
MGEGGGQKDSRFIRVQQKFKISLNPQIVGVKKKTKEEREFLR